MDIYGFMSVDVPYIHATQFLSSSESMPLTCPTKHTLCRSTNCVVVVSSEVDVEVAAPVLFNSFFL